MSKNNIITYPFIGGLVLIFIFVLVVAWALLSPLLGVGYKYARMVETLTLWGFTDYGEYYMKIGFPKEYDFYSIFWSSLPFGLAFTGLIFLMGLWAQHRIQTSHINATIRHPDGVGLRPKELMRRMAEMYPHNQFYLNLPLSRYNMEYGAASMPLTAIQLLVDAEAINISDARDFSESTNYTVDKTRLKSALIDRFGQTNPFLEINWTKRDEIADTVESLEWHTVVILYASIARIDALVTGVGDEYQNVLVDIDEYMKSIWRSINNEYDKVAKKKKKLMIGPYEVEEGKTPNAKRSFMRFKQRKEHDTETDAKMVLLDEHLRATAPNWATVKTARTKLTELLTKPMSNKKSKRSISDEIDRIFKRHGYLSGVLASSLVETRFAGIFNPAIFNWMRFYDRNLWRFLNYVGMNTPSPECAGVFDHWQTEMMADVALGEPEISGTTIDNIIREARKYTPKNLRVANADELAAEIFGSTNDAQDIINRMEKAAALYDEHQSNLQS